MKTQPGWYPDPDGTPQRVRWWDGQRWSERTQPDADEPTPVAQARTGPILLGVLVLAVAVAALGSLTLDPRRPNSAFPMPASGISAENTPSLNGTPRPTIALPPIDPTASPTEGSVTRLQRNCPGATHLSTRIGDGTTRAAVDGDWQRVALPSWMDCGQAAVYRGTSAIVSIGQSEVSDRENLEDSAELTWESMMLELGGPTILNRQSRPLGVAGRPGWRILSTLSFPSRPTCELTVIVRDNDTGHNSVVISLLTTNDQRGATAIDRVMDSLGNA